MRPHVVMCVIDQCRIDRLQVHPIFSELKKYGVYLDNVITYAPYTIASMHAIFSGVNGQNNGVNGYYKYEQFKNEKLMTMPEYLKSAGYFTVGDFINKMTAPKKGWDIYEIHDEYKDDLVNRHKEILRNHLQKEKSFIYLHYSNIHTEMVKQVFNIYDDNDERYFNQIESNRKRYDQFVLKAGNYLSKIWEEIKERIVKGEIIFIVITDHGCSLGERKGEKAYGVYTFDYTLKVFHYLIAPGILPVGVHNSSLLRTIDLLPTLLDMLNIFQVKKEINIQGESYLNLLREKKIVDRMAYSETGGLGGPFPSPDEPNVRCIRKDDWKLIYYTASRKKTLFNIKNDPEERNDIAKNNPQIVLQLWKHLLNQSKVN